MKTARIRVMIVEAHPAHAEAIRKALKGSGTVWDIQVAGSLKEYYEAIASKPPDIVLMGMDLPDGRATDALTAPPENAPFPILVITSHGNGKAAVEAMKSGALDYIVESPEAFAETPRKVVRALREWSLLKKAQQKDEQLRQSEERYRTITENMSDTVWVMDLDFKTTYISPSVLRTRGFTLEELQALPLDRHMTPESFKIASQALAEEMTPKKLAKKDLVISRQLDLEFYRKDGTIFWGDVVMTLVRDSEGKPREIIGVGRDITEKRKFEGALKKAAEEWRATFDSITDLISILDADYRITRVSKSLADFLKMKPKDLIGKRCYEVIHGTKEPPSFCPHKRVFETKKSIEEEIFEPRYGMYMHLADSPIMDEKGDVVGSVHVLKNITERKRVEETLRESEERYRLLFENATIGIFHSLPEGKYLRVNPALARMVGFGSPEEMVSTVRDISSEIYLDSRQRSSLLKEAIEKGEWTSIEGQFRHRDGRILMGRQLVHAVLKADGSVNYLEGFVEDITEQKRTEEALKESEKKHRTILHTMEDGYFEVDLSGTFTSFNESMRRMLGFDQEEMAGLNYRRYMDEETAKKVFLTFNEVFRSGVPAKTADWRFKRKDGVTIDFETSISLKRNELGEPAGFFGIARDITDRRRMEEALRESDIRFKKLSSNVPGMIYQFLKRPDGTYCVPFTTEAIKDIFGCSPQDVRGDFSPIAKVILPEDLQKVVDSIDASAERMTTWQCEYRVQIPGQPPKWLFGQSTPEKLADGSIIWHGFNTDITERKRAEEAVRESEANLSMAQRIAGTGSWDWDLSTNQLVWSAETFRIFGRDVNEYTPNVDDALTSVHPDDRELLEQKVRTSIEHDQPYEHEYRIVDPAGEIKYLHAVGEIVRDEKGKPVRLRGAIQDITRRKRAEEALVNSESLLNTTQRLAKIGGWDWNVDDQTMFWTDETYRIHGVSPGEIAPGLREHIERSIECYDPEDRPVILAAFNRCVEKGESYDLELPFVTCQGSRIWIRTTAQAVIEKDRIVRVVGTIMDITERKRAEQALRESEERFKQVAESAGEWIWEVNADGLYTYASPIVEKILGYKPEEIVGKKYFYDFFLPEEKKTFKAAALAAFAAKRPLREFINRNVHKSGETIWLSTSGSPMLDDKGTLIGYRGADTDITERKRAEEELKESEERYRELVENIEDIVYVTDGTGRIIFLNNAFTRISGYTDQEMLQKSYMELLTPESLKDVLELFKKQKKAQDVGVFEMSFFDKDGTVKTIEVREKHILENGRVVEVHGLGRDVTDRKRAEEALKESEEKFRSLFKTSRDFLSISNLEGTIIEVNDAALEFFGYSSEEISRTRMHELYADSEDRQSLIHAVIESGYVENKEIRMKKKDGEIIDALVTANLIRDNHGKPIGFFGSARDVTEKRKLEHQLLQSEKLSAVGTMISGVAHELNNPLTSIIGNAQLLAKRDVPDDIKSKLSVILKESIRSSKIVAGLLAFAREHKPERKMIDIGDILMESVKLREYDVKVSNIDMRVSLSENIPKIYADPYQLQQVFINLINNARDVLVGQQSAALSIRTYRKDDDVLIEFEDNGPGIPSKITKKIFDPFFTTKEVGKGTGLGLSIAYGIVKEHDGMISVESEPTKGAKFTVTLPIRDDIQPAVGAAKTAVKPPPGTRTVLVVEDEPSLRDLLMEALTDDGFFVESASTGDEAISLVEERKYDAIISDIKMPGIGGKELYLYIQKNHPEIVDKIIFITGDILSKDTQSFLQITNNRFIEKPFNIDALAALLNDVLAG